MSQTSSRESAGGYFGVAALGLAAVVMACSGGTSDGQGRLSASWKGADSGQLAAPATAAWCASGGLLEIMAIVRDSGVAVLMYPTNGVRSDSFAVIDPLRQTVHAGGAALAARWPVADEVIGLRGVSGAVRLRVDDGTLSGDLEGRMVRPGVIPESLVFSGSFAGLKADSGPTACPPDSGARRPPNDSAVASPRVNSDHP